MDLMAFIKNPIEIEPYNLALIPTGITVAIPNDLEIQIRPRSGLAAKSNISVLNTLLNQGLLIEDTFMQIS